MIRKQIAIQIPTPTTLIMAYFSIATDRICVPTKTVKADHGRVLVDEEQGIAQGFEDIVGREKQEAVESQQERLGRFPCADVSKEPEKSVEQIIFSFRLI